MPFHAGSRRAVPVPAGKTYKFPAGLGTSPLEIRSLLGFVDLPLSLAGVDGGEEKAQGGQSSPSSCKTSGRVRYVDESVDGDFSLKVFLVSNRSSLFGSPSFKAFFNPLIASCVN